MGGLSKRMFRFLILKIDLKKDVNMFGCMEISETIYEGLVELYY